MSTRKTNIDIGTVKSFLEKNLGHSISNLMELSGGEMSYPVAFTFNNTDYVIRIDPYVQSYLKDQYAWDHYSSIKLPIPEMVKLGKFDDVHYFAITKRAKGKTLDSFTVEETQKIIPSLISVLDEIHKTNISNTTGYGYLDDKALAKFSTWKNYVLSVDERHDEWKNKYPLIKNYEDIFGKIHNKIKDLSNYCPEERFLLHGDYGYTNVISDGDKVTGVLDWGESRYGDFVFDIAWLDMWQDEINYQVLFKKHYEHLGIPTPHYNERLKCYKLMNCYGGLEFYIESNQLDKIDWLIKKIPKLLAN